MHQHPILTPRDQIAIEMMKAFVPTADRLHGWERRCAETAYRLADALMAEGRIENSHGLTYDVR